MTTSREAELMYVLGSVGFDLSHELTKVGRSVILKCSSSPNFRWAHPPLKIVGNLLDFPLSSLPDLMLGDAREQLNVPDAWEQIVEAMTLSSKPHEQIVAAVPGCPMKEYPTLGDTLGRVLGFFALGGGKFSANSSIVRLFIGDEIYGFGTRSILHQGRFKAIHARCHMTLDLRQSLAGPGVSLQSDDRLRDLDAHFARHLPKYRSGLRFLIAAAVHKGPEFVTQLLDSFKFDDTLERRIQKIDPQSPWGRALELVSTSEMNPVKELRELLRDYVGSEVFMKRLGNPSSKKQYRYKESTRAKHLNTLVELEASPRLAQATKADRPSKREIEQIEAAEKLLELQRRIGLG